MDEVLISYVVMFLLFVLLTVRFYRRMKREASLAFVICAVGMTWMIWRHWSDCRHLGDTEKAMYLLVPSPSDFMRVRDSLLQEGVEPDVSHVDTLEGTVTWHPNPEFILPFKPYTVYRTADDDYYVLSLVGKSRLDCCGR